jgi:hypothetical protein
MGKFKFRCRCMECFLIGTVCAASCTVVLFSLGVI